MNYINTNGIMEMFGVPSTYTINTTTTFIDKKPKNSFEIKKVHFNDPATVVIWADGTKTVVKCDEEDIYDPQTGLLMCIAKKAFGNKGRFNDILREWMPEEPEEETYITRNAQAFFDGLNNYFFGMEARG